MLLSSVMILKRISSQELSIFSEILSETARWLEEKGQPLWSPSSLTPEKLLEHYPQGALYLGWLEGQAVATAVLLEQDPLFWPDALPQEALYLHKLSVARAWSGRGLGQQILDAARAETGQRGRRFLRLDTVSHNPALNEFYTKYGFARVAQDVQVGIYAVNLYQLEV